jgi:alpha-galactosidase
MCPPRRDNKLVTSAVIARKYEKFIFANPCWKLGHMLQTVQEEMFANVFMSKLKRAKVLVMKKALDATKEQYSRLYDYQMELLRTTQEALLLFTGKIIYSLLFLEECTYVCMPAKKGSKLAVGRLLG